MRSDECYDAVIVGAGISGLSTGALLSKKGYKILVLDKKPYIGGRASTIALSALINGNSAKFVPEWTAEDVEGEFLNTPINYGFHVVVPGGFLERLLYEIDVLKDIELKGLDSHVFYFERSNRWIRVPEKINPRGLLSFYKDLSSELGLSFREQLRLLRTLVPPLLQDTDIIIDKYKNTSTLQFLREIGIDRKSVLDFVKVLSKAYSMMPSLEKHPLCEIIVNLKQLVGSLAKKQATMYDVIGGFGQISEKLKECVEEGGNDIKLNSNVIVLEITGDRIHGVHYTDSSGYTHSVKTENVVFTGTYHELGRLLRDSGYETEEVESFLNVDPQLILTLFIGAHNSIFDGKDPSLLHLFRKGGRNFSVSAEHRCIPGFPFRVYSAYLLDSELTTDDALSCLSSIFERTGFNKDNIRFVLQVPMIGYGRRRTINRNETIPSIDNLYYVGDSNNYLTGIEGCVKSAVQLVNENF